MFIAENMGFVEGISLRNVHKMPNQNGKEGKYEIMELLIMILIFFCFYRTLYAIQKFALELLG